MNTTTNAASPDAMRKAFEADYFKDMFPDAQARTRSGDGYMYMAIQSAWSTWKAAWIAALSTAGAAPQPAAPQDEFLPLLARDIANELGTTSINVCNALRTLGFGCFSLNMAITKTMAAKLREYFADQPQEAAPAAVPDDVIRKELVRDLNEVFEPKGAETPQIVRDVIEYTDSWLSVFIQKRAETAPRPAEGVPAQGDAELLAEAKSEGYESSLAYVQALKQHVATYQAERNSAREAYRRVRDKVEAQDTEDQRELVSIGRAVNRAATDLPAGARLQIDLERDAGSVCWLDHRKGVWLTIEGAGELFSVQIHAAIDAAIAQAKESST